MTKQKDNIIYDSYSDKTWNMEGFFEVLADFYEGKPEMMAEELVQAVKTINLLVDDSTFGNEVQETSTNLLHVRDALIEIKNVELVINN